MSAQCLLSRPTRTFSGPRLRAELDPERTVAQPLPWSVHGRPLGPIPIIGTTVPAPCLRSSAQWPSEAEFVAVGIGQVEEPLAPFGIARRSIGVKAGRDYSCVQAVDIGVVEDHTPPPRPGSLDWLGDEIEIAGSRTKAREGCIVAAINQIEAKHAIEANGACHVVRSPASAFDQSRLGRPRSAVSRQTGSDDHI